MNQTRFRILFVGLAAWPGLGFAASCSVSDQAPGEGRVGHPGPGSEPPPPSTSLAPPPAPASESSEPLEHPPSLSEADKQPSQSTLSPLDKAIAEDEPSRPWSKNVPKRRCTTDDECGDGFCDRGRCAAIWTYRESYGQRCEWDRQCATYLCIEGRCRSCTSDEDCTRVTWKSNVKCTSVDKIPSARECVGNVGSIPGALSPGPPPQRPSQ